MDCRHRWKTIERDAFRFPSKQKCVICEEERTAINDGENEYFWLFSSGKSSQKYMTRTMEE